MRLVGLAIMFIVLILPLSMVLSSYTESRVDTLRLQSQYDVKLDNATADAITAFQTNSYNGDESILANYKMEDIEAAANTFYNSLRTSFSMGGYNNQDIQDFVPALVFILYDGYYIYSPYQNTWDQETIDNTDMYESNEEDTASYHGGLSSDPNREKLYGLKPYIYYSCRYKRGSTDVIITYSLDNYITIKGTIGSEIVNESGYLLSDVSESGGAYIYRGNNISVENDYEETILYADAENGTVLPCKKVNGRKYYYDSTTGETFSFFNGDKLSANTAIDVVNNDNAVQYYKQAYELKQFINSHDELKRLKTTDAVIYDKDGNQYSKNDLINEFEFGDYEIFAELDDSLENSIEDEDSLFNNHRMDIIKYSVERNLSIAVSNYNNYSPATSNFQMMELKDHEWEQISNNISMISFLQGLPIGAKVYNGYSIVSNNKNQELVSEDSIYILTSDGVYHDIYDSELYDGSVNLAGAKGYYNINFERKSGFTSDSRRRYYFPIEGVTACYNSIVNRRNLSDQKISQLLNGQSYLATVYYTALGRERYGLYRDSNPTNYEDIVVGEEPDEEPDEEPISMRLVMGGMSYNSNYAIVTLNVIPNELLNSVTIRCTTTRNVTQMTRNRFRITKNGVYTFYATLPGTTEISASFILTVNRLSN